MIDEQNTGRSKQGWLLATGLASLLITLPSLLAAQQITGTPGTPSATMTLDGKQLPPEPPKFGGVINETAKDSKPYWPPSVVPPKGAPNVLLIMTDDQGYGVSGTFGGVIPTPNMDRIAKAGLRYTQFHSTALCSPTRAALITGRNHHSVGFGVIGEMSTGYPGYDSVIGGAPDGTILRQRVCHLVVRQNHNTPIRTARPVVSISGRSAWASVFRVHGRRIDQWTLSLSN
jgi:arylsulfatase